MPPIPGPALGPIPANTDTNTRTLLLPSSQEAEGQGLAERLAQVPGVTSVETTGPDRVRLLADRDVRPDAAAAVVHAGGRLRRLSVEEPSLEAIYTRYFHDHGAQHAA